MKTLFKYIKSPEQIKEQIEFWFLKYHAKEKSDFDGSEEFTFFDFIYKNKQVTLLKSTPLNNSEIPVLILKISEKECIINTTEKFIRIKDSKTEFINYVDFKYHKGFHPSIGVRDKLTNKLVSVKTDGYISEFGLVLINDEMILWHVPTGSSGFAFWNITKKCNLIGHKYLEAL